MENLFLSVLFLGFLATACKKETETRTVKKASDSTESGIPKDTLIAVSPTDTVAMQKAWEKYMTPGKEHQMLAADNGNWDAEATMYMSANDPKPVKSKMSATSKMVLGGRYQEQRFTGSMMNQPFEGISTVAYNTASNQIESTWIDNMGTGMMFLKGNYDGKANSMETKGEFTDPMTGKVKPLRQVYTMTDPDNRKIEMFDVDSKGAEYKSMEIVMTRKN